MAKRDPAAALRAIEALEEHVPALKKKDSASDDFRKWRASAVKVLRRALGSQSDIVGEFESIRFAADPRVSDAIARRLKRVAIALPRGKVTELVRPKPDRTQLQAKQFERALSEASEALLQAKLRLRAESRKAPKP